MRAGITVSSMTVALSGTYSVLCTSSLTIPSAQSAGTTPNPSSMQQRRTAWRFTACPALRRAVDSRRRPAGKGHSRVQICAIGRAQTHPARAGTAYQLGVRRGFGKAQGLTQLGHGFPPVRDQDLPTPANHAEIRAQAILQLAGVDGDHGQECSLMWLSQETVSRDHQERFTLRLDLNRHISPLRGCERRFAGMDCADLPARTRTRHRGEPSSTASRTTSRYPQIPRESMISAHRPITGRG